ncbi:MAG: cytochrome c peroxidase [Polyangiaceae bacterium]
MWTLLIGLSFALVLGASRCHSASAPEAPPPADRTANATDPAPTWTGEEWAALQSLSPTSLPAPPADPTNRFAGDPAAAALGQRLFYDPSFSGPLLDSDNDGGPQSLGAVGQTGRVACAGCHVPDSGFSDTRSFQRQISLGAGWGRRRAPSLLDVGQAKLIMWDGRRDALYNQIFGPLESVVEMNTSRLYVAQQIRRRYAREYEAIFGALPPLDDPRQFPKLSAAATGCQPKSARDPQPVCDGTFHGMPGDHAEFDGLTPDKQRAVTAVVVNAGKAIAAFERLITCGSAPFDAWMHGKIAVSPAAQRGAALFVGRAGCVRCHSGPFLSDQKFHNVGLKPQVVQQAFTDANDRGAAAGLAAALADPLNSAGPFSDGNDGRLPSSVGPEMEGAFRTPTLRCLSARPTFLHTGQIRTLGGVVSFFNQGGNAAGYPGTKEIRPLGLSALEQSDLVAFLESLNGPGADPKYRRPP